LIAPGQHITSAWRSSDGAAYREWRSAPAPRIVEVPARLADLLAGLSRLADCGFGLPVGSAVRSCLLATRLARSLDLPTADIQASFYTALLHHVGCVGHAHETARLFGDDLAANVAAGRTDSVSARDVVETFLPLLTRGRPPLERLRLVFTAATRGGRWGDQFTATACEVGRHTAQRLGLPESVQTSQLHVYDPWRGKTRPDGLTGAAVPVGARIARLAAIAVLFEGIGGTDLVVQALRRRAGGMLDPTLVDHFTRHATQWLADLSEAEAHAAVLEAEPHPHVTVPDVRRVAEIFGDLADLKSPYFLGHSRAVAALATGAADRLGLPDGGKTDLALAALLHDVGRVAVSNAVWEKPGRLSVDEWEQVRLHPYRSERILVGSDELARLAPLVGRHHERLDGTGYHRGCSADQLSTADRILAAADAYRTLTEPRPHRAALPPLEARERVAGAARRGVLDTDAVDAVLVAAGHPVPLRPKSLPMGLTDREVEVLGLLARGCSNAGIADRLVISRRTAEHHVQHIYTKIGVSSRAAATLFAVEHELLDRDG
jgi:HD-GYP domain-containing protein (c-di-GMP phosphodiesterase class II)/DNA-binding CsgD family transcriptional regulator